MLLSLRRVLIAGGLLALGAAGALLLREAGWWWVAPAGASLAAAAWYGTRPPAHERLVESERIESLGRSRLAELVRGTSALLIEMRYRYSVRADIGAREPFSARVNQIQLGFVPVIIMDNETDRQGQGFVAFVHDGHRWRGPGLPCPGSREDALSHAARCVEPLAHIEDSAG